MVSNFCLVVLTLATAPLVVSAPAQLESSQNAFREEAAKGQNTSTPAPKPERLITPEMRGDIFMARKMYREATVAYQEGSQNSAVLLNKTGIAYHQLQEYTLAERFYRLAIRANPHYPEAINNLGTIYYARKSYRRAVGQYKAALRISPKSASIWSNLGTGYFARKDYKRADDSWQQALALDPDVFENRNTQGILLQERTVEERAKFHYFIARRYAKAGMNDRALLYMRKSLEEGFKERKRFQEDPEFAPLRELPEFKELLAMEQRVL